jgi:photosystem II stability/assembly factor-like uncharacterized protein
MVLVALAGLAACGANTVATRPPHAPVTNATTTTTTATAPTPCGEPVTAPQNCLVALSFIDDEDGFWIYENQTTASGTPLDLVQTNNAGTTWEVVAQTPDPGIAIGGASLLFIDAQDGFLWGPSGLFATHDGGHSWVSVPLSGRVVDVTSTPDSVWATVSTCPEDPAAAPITAPCSVGVETSSDAGRTWHGLGGVPADAYEVGQLAFDSPSIVFLGEWRSAGALPLAPGVLLVTTDGGASWTTHPLPCPSSYRLGGMLSVAPSSGTVWMVCHGQGSGGIGGLVIYRSTDSGATWQAESGCMLGGATGVPQPPNAPCGKLQDFVALSSTEAFALSINGGLVRTDDGGVSWSPAGSSAMQTESSGFLGALDFVDPTHGWVSFWITVVGPWHGLWRTTDGGATWSPG